MEKKEKEGVEFKIRNVPLIVAKRIDEMAHLQGKKRQPFLLEMVERMAMTKELKKQDYAFKETVNEMLAVAKETNEELFHLRNMVKELLERE